MTEWRLEVEGTDAAGLAAELAALSALTLAVEARHQVMAPPAPPPGQRDVALTLAAAAVVLALPGALKDGIDLAERFRLKERLEGWLVAARSLVARHGGTVRLDTPDGARDLSALTADQCLDALIAIDRRRYY